MKFYGAGKFNGQSLLEDDFIFSIAQPLRGPGVLKECVSVRLCVSKPPVEWNSNWVRIQRDNYEGDKKIELGS